MTIGHDTNLFRSGLGVLQTDSLFSTTANSGKNTLHLNNTAANVGMTIGQDTNLYRSGANVLSTDDRFAITINGGKDTLSLTDTVGNVGMTIGHDTNLYRLNPDILKTDDSLVVDVNLTVNGNTSLGDATTDTLTVTATPTINIPDNTTNAFRIKEATSNYLLLTTTDSSELVTIGAIPKFTSLNVTEATSSAAAGATFAGGVGVTKKLWVGGDFQVDGASFAVNSTSITLGDTNTDSVTINAGPISLVNATTVADALEFGNGPNLANLYRSANDTLKTDDAFSSSYAGGKTTLSLTDTTTSVGITFGGDTNLYRPNGSADTLKTDDSLVVDVNLTVNGNTALGNLETDTLTVTATPTINIPDNTANAFRLKEGTNNYLSIDTVDGSEFITLGYATAATAPKVKISNVSDSSSSTAGSLQVAGGAGIAKSLSVGTYINRSVATVSAGTDALGQGPLTKDLNIVTVNSPAGAVTLPTPVIGMQILISNKTLNALKVYPSTASIQIDALGVGVAFTSITASTAKSFVATSATQWYSI